MQTYAKPAGEGKSGTAAVDMITARGDLLAQSGRILLKVGQALEQAVKKATAQRLPLTPAARLQILKEECADKFNRAEDYFRKQLVKQNLYAEGDLPAVVHPIATDVAKPVKVLSQDTLPSVKN